MIWVLGPEGTKTLTAAFQANIPVFHLGPSYCCPEGPSEHLVDTLVPKYPHREHFEAKVYIIYNIIDILYDIGVHELSGLAQLPPRAPHARTGAICSGQVLAVLKHAVGSVSRQCLLLFIIQSEGLTPFSFE